MLKTQNLWNVQSMLDDDESKGILEMFETSWFDFYSRSRKWLLLCTIAILDSCGSGSSGSGSSRVSCERYNIEGLQR